MAMAVTADGKARIVLSPWEPAIRRSAKACEDERHGRPIADQLGARVYAPPLRVTREYAGWHVVETWTVWPDCLATVAPLADVIAIVPLADFERWPDPERQILAGQRYLSLDALLGVIPCARPVDDAFDILYLAQFDGDTLRKLVTNASAEPPLPFCPAGPVAT